MMVRAAKASIKHLVEVEEEAMTEKEMRYRALVIDDLEGGTGETCTPAGPIIS